jgi:protein-S-isoprenylcysteine O-methyltransferase Ste14
MSLPLSQITFTFTVLVTTYLIRYTGQDPNPPKPEDKSTARGKSSARSLPAKDKGPKELGTRHASTDSLISTYFNVTPARYINIITAIGVAHAIFALIPDAGREAICPNYQLNNTNPSPMYFTWNTYTSSTLLFIWTSLLLRIAAYRSLGSSFTFRITKPTSGLKTTGVHRFIRHPSYTGYFGSTIGMVMLFLRARGLMGCIVGPGVVGKVVEGLFWVWAVALVPAVFWVRVREEEAFLAEEFGEEWEAYVERTWMFVPGVL